MSSLSIMDKKSSPQIYGVLGYPVKHSLSPEMHNAAFRALGMNAEYRLFEVKPQELGNFMTSLSSNGIYGLNVTIPYKEKVLRYLQWVSPEVRFTGASNTIKIKDKNYLEGWNTDGIGFHRHLTKDLHFDITDKKTAVLGAGGAAKAITNQLARHGAKGIVIYDIDEHKGSQLAEKLNQEFPKCKTTCVNSVKSLDLANSDLLVNATPVGMQESDECLISPDAFQPGIIVYDLIYNPPETKLLRLAKQRGARTSNGLGMLLYQGALSFEHFTGETAPVEVMRQELERVVKKI